MFESALVCHLRFSSPEHPGFLLSFGPEGLPPSGGGSRYSRLAHWANDGRRVACLSASPKPCVGRSAGEDHVMSRGRVSLEPQTPLCPEAGESGPRWCILEGTLASRGAGRSNGEPVEKNKKGHRA